MATSLYFHIALNPAATGTFPSTEQSSATANESPFDAQSVNRYMNTTVGTGQTSLQSSASFFTNGDKVYITKFVSDPLTSNTSIAANTWTYGAGFSDVSLGGAFPAGNSSGAVFPSTMYVWRPSTGAKVGNIFDGNSATATGYGAASSERAVKVTFTGSAVSALANDVLIFEAWGLSSTASTQQYNYFFDGTNTSITDATSSNNNIASNISTPQTLTFTSPPTIINCTVTGKSLTNKIIHKH